jgi:3-phytase
VNLGGPWSQGLLVVQDGRKRMPEQTQNFKFVPWAQVTQALNLP